MEIDTSGWSGEGSFTQVLIDRLEQLEEVVFLRVEDAPATRSEADYNFISNELFVAFATRPRREAIRRFGIVPGSRLVQDKAMGIGALETALSASPDVGPADYHDEGMIQYLRTERIVPPYQTRGYKLVELVRIYEVGADPRR
jgi:hypothetical protein